MKRFAVIHLVAILLACGLLSVAGAQKPVDKKGDSDRRNPKATKADKSKSRSNSKSRAKSKSRKRRNSKPATPVSPERAAHVMTFVKRHHPELESLLVHLKAEDKRAYNRAIRDLYRVSEVLISIREKDPEGYDLELGIWKVKSRSMLLATQYKMSREKKLRKQLEDLLNKQVDLQLKRLRRDRQRRLERIKRLDKQIDKVESLRKKTVQRQFRLLTQGPPRKKSKPARSKVSTEGGKSRKARPGK